MEWTKDKWGCFHVGNLKRYRIQYVEENHHALYWSWNNNMDLGPEQYYIGSFKILEVAQEVAKFIDERTLKE